MEEARTPEVVERKYELAKIDPIAKIIATLDEKYANTHYDLTTTKGMAVAKIARAELRGLRVRLEEARKEEKADVLERGRYIDGMARTLQEAILKHEEPLDEQIKAEEDRKEKERKARMEVEAARVTAIQKKIDNFRNAAAGLTNSPSAEIQAALTLLKSTEVTEPEYQEFTAVAQGIREGAIASVERLLANTLKREEEEARLQAEREALEKRRKEQEAREKEAERKRLADEAKAKADREAEEARLKTIREAEEKKIIEIREAEERRIKDEWAAEEKRLRELREAEEAGLARERTWMKNVQAIRDIPYAINHLTASSKEIYDLMIKIEALIITDEEYGIYAEDAKESVTKVMVRLQEMKVQTIDREDREARIRTEREEADRKRQEQEAIEAENRRKQEELDRQKRDQEERTRALEERKVKLAASRKDTPIAALIEIHNLAKDRTGRPDDSRVRADIEILAEANILVEDSVEVDEPKKKRGRSVRTRTVEAEAA